MLRVGIVGATGYAGKELVRILLRHSKVQITTITSESYAGSSFGAVYPEFRGLFDYVLSRFDQEELKAKTDLVFSALPHGLSQEKVPLMLSAVEKVIDLSGDFRLSDASLYEEWYGYKHQAKELLADSVYGLPELNKEKIKTAKLIANPGCYPTAALLALLPALKNKLIDLTSIIIDAKSGVSGAGRTAKISFHFPECNENLKAYRLGKHQHVPEIEEQATIMAGENIILNFTPHLIPMTRGILNTIYLRLTENINQDKIFSLYSEYYSKESFVRILFPPELPETRYVTGTNFCDISLRLDIRNNMLIVVSVIDNLVKGAAGQAVQNMNILQGWPEEEGLIL